MALPYYQFFDTVLRPRLNKAPVSDVTELRRIMTEYQVNEPQAIAISTALRTEGFTLIQG
jgi:senataxin